MADSITENYLRQNAGKPFTSRDLADATRQKIDTVDSVLRRLDARGLVRKFKPEHGPNIWTWTGDQEDKTPDPGTLPARDNCAPKYAPTAPAIPVGVFSERSTLARELVDVEDKIAELTKRRAEILDALR